MNVFNTIDTESGDKQVWWILLQEQIQGPTRPRGCWSLSLNQAKTPYYKTGREYLDLVRNVQCGDYVFKDRGLISERTSTGSDGF